MTYLKGDRVLVQGTALGRVAQTWSNSDKIKVRQDNGAAVIVRKPLVAYIGRKPEHLIGIIL